MGIRIALFEENAHFLAPLRAFLLLAGHSISTCSKEGYPLATFLQELIEEPSQPGTPCYDLLIIDVSEASPIDEILILLERLVREQTTPIILLAEVHNQAFESLRAKVTIVPVLSRTLLNIQELLAAVEVTMGMTFPLPVSVLRLVQQWQYEHLHSSFQAEQAWITTRRKWLSQRQEWLCQRQEWLCQRLVWIAQQRKLPDPQLEWLEGQQTWLEQQQDEVNQQQRWLQHNRHWLDQHQRRLDQLMLQQPLTDVE